MKTRLLNNLGLKVAALILAFLAWLAVININDPVMTKTITGIPVSMTNTAYVESIGKACLMEDGSSTVSVVITGHRSIVEPLTRENVHAEADLTQIVDMEADPVMVPVQVSASGVASENITATPGNIPIVLEEMSSADFMVTPTTGDTRPYTTNYEVGQMTATPDTITITGPETLISIIDRVMAPVDVSLMNADGTVRSSVQIYDKNGQLFTDTQMESIRFSEETGSVMVSIDLYEVVSGITLRALTSGSPAQGYRVGDITITPAEITISGRDEALQKLEDQGNTITIPSEYLDVTGRTSDLEERIDLTSVLPDGIRLSEGSAETALVVVEILALDSRTIEIPTNAIDQKNLSDGLAVVFQRNTFRVRLQGSGDAFNALNADDIEASIDFSGLSAGSQQEIEVSIETPGVDAQAETTTVILDIVSIENTTTPETSD